MKLSTSGPAIFTGTVEIKDDGDIVAVAVVEALNLAASHLQARVTEEQAMFAVLALARATLGWAATEGGVMPEQVAGMCLSLPTPGKTLRIKWQVTPPKLIV